MRQSEHGSTDNQFVNCFNRVKNDMDRPLNHKKEDSELLLHEYKKKTFCQYNTQSFS